MDLSVPSENQALRALSWRLWGKALNAPDPTTFYTPGEKGYTDYPAEG